METVNVTYGTAFLGGLVSFITPCVLPLVPVYLSILSGSSFDALTGKKGDLTPAEKKEIHKAVLLNALFFIIGFSFIFVMLGFLSGSVGESINKWGAKVIPWLIRIIGIMMVLFGLNMSGVYKPMFLNTEARFQLRKGKFGLLSSAVVGAIFAFGWTPCVGPILAPILVMAAGTGSKLKGTLLLVSYSLGLGIPFFLSALSINGLLAFSNKMKRYFNAVEITIGMILIFVGIFLAIAGFEGLNRWREKMSWLDSVTSKIEMGVAGKQSDDKLEMGENGVVPINEEDLGRQ